MIFARQRKDAVLMFLSDKKQSEHDLKRWGDRPDVVGDELGNNFRCFFCGAPPGKQCVMADGKFRNYPHQKRRDVASAHARQQPNA
jgi:hypothetical protein